MGRLGLAVALGLLLGLGLPASLHWSLRVLAGWDLLALVFLGWVWLRIRQADAAETRRLATLEDDSRTISSLLVLAGSLVSLVGSGFGLSEARHLEGQGHLAASLVLTGVSLLSVALSWLLIHTEHTLHYAHLYYNAPVGGIDFHETEEDPDGQDPDYRDFAYLAFTVGMTYQVSDTEVNHKRFRRRLTLHALLSFVFGTVIVAFTINIVAGFIQ